VKRPAAGVAETDAAPHADERPALARSIEVEALSRAFENDALARLMARLHPAIRREFPALRRNMAGGRRVYLNNAGGTIVTRRSAAMMAHTALWANPQDGDITDGERLTAELHAGARAAAADFLNAPSPHEISFHQSASHALFNLSFALRDHLRRGDNLVVTHLDHAANVSPWESIWGEDRGLEIRECRVQRDGTLDLDHLARLVDRRTRVVAVTCASNGLGTVVPVAEVARLAHRYGLPRPPARPGRRWDGALVVVDAVHHAPHGPIDVRALGCDFLVFSGYKLFGPMTGVLWGRRRWLDALRPYRVAPNADIAPTKYEQGTPNHAVMLGLAGALHYLAWLGGRVETAGAAMPALEPLRRELRRRYPDAMRRRLKWAMHAIRAWERGLTETLLRRWAASLAPRGVTLHGLTDPARAGERDPTFLFEVRGRTQEEVKRQLWRRARIEVPSGNYYSLAVTRHLKSRRTIRASFAHYDTPETVRLLIDALARLSPPRRRRRRPAPRRS
jgi:cysteine desulfurase family protein (TIGR01976 family)